MESILGDHPNTNGKVAAAAHVLAIPLSTQGHISPMLRFVTQLARESITVTFVSFQDEIAQLTAADGSGSELRSLGIRFVGLPKPESADHGPGVSLMVVARDLRDAMKPLTEQFLRDKSAGVGGPTSILVDVMLPWSRELGATLEIPRYVLHTTGVIFARAVQGFVDCYENGQIKYSDMGDGKMDYFEGQVIFPGLPPLRYYELPRSFREDPAETLLRAESMVQADGHVLNTFLELEEKVIDSWRNTVQRGKVPKFFLVGPLVSTSGALRNDSVGQGLEDSARKCLQFLGSQAPSSVLYVAFGSQTLLSPEQIKELALGLEGSEQNFLWVIPQSKGGSSGKQNPSLAEVLPPGFEERLGERCCIVTGWAPQLQILAHSSTGGCLMHVGWNSTLESIVMGMPMIACPQKAEQHVNCRYLVDDLKIAVELATGPDKVFERNEVERVVRLLMVESEGKAIRRRVEELRRKAAAAVAEGGSKPRAFQEFLGDIRNLNLSPQPRSN